MSKPSSTMSFAEARAEADKWGNLIRALARLQETAETLGAFEQNRSERQVELDRLAGEIGAAHEQLAELQKAVAEAETMATAILDEARTHASDLKAKAQQQADQLLADAQAQMRKADAAVKAARSEVEAAQSLRAEVEDAAAQAEGRLNAARAAARAVIEE